ncbi:MAG: hypothetical protein NTV19_14105 [Burkholderiales bacterium]|nr:hypothetical protein [Burkholderiales bacterium]
MKHIVLKPDDSSLSVAQRRSLRCLVALMIPASAYYQVPGADDETIFADIVATLKPHAVLAGDAIGRLDALAGGCFADLPEDQRDTVAQDFRRDRSALVNLLVSVTVQCYYRDDRVMRSLGMPVRAPFPEGYELAPSDWSLLDPVRARPKLYREVP